MLLIEHISFELKSLLTKSKHVVITGHTKPDGDCVGAALGLGMALKKFGHEVKILLEDYPQNLYFIQGRELLTDVASNEIDLMICLDCADESRLGENSKYLTQAKKTVNIDHHMTNTKYCDNNYIFEDASSTSEIVFEIIRSEFWISEEIATALYAGIIFDTGGLRHPNTSYSTFEAALQLYRSGAKISEITTKVLLEHTVSQARLLCRAVERMVLHADGKVCYSYVDLDDYEQTGSNPIETEGIVEYLKTTSGVKVGAFLYMRDNNNFKLSLRSDKEIDICRVAQKFGGGGHRNACGCDFDLLSISMDEAIKQVMDEVDACLQETEKI